MAALLVALSVMAVLMTAVMPVWHHMAQRERYVPSEHQLGVTLVRDVGAPAAEEDQLRHRQVPSVSR